MLKPIRFLVFHHTASAPSITLEQIDAAHRAKGWEGAGYSFFVDADGVVWPARGLRRILAANPPHNSDSIAVAVAGWNGNDKHPEWEWSVMQWATIHWFVRTLSVLIPGLTIGGHRDIGSTPTDCPGLDILAEFEDDPHEETIQ